jgi:ElaB protein
MASEVSSGVQTAYDQTVKAVGEAYDKTSEVLTKTYDQTMTYGRDNPGKLTLIAFGAGIGIGVLLASGFGGRRSNRRFTEPIVNALSEVALQFFR